MVIETVAAGYPWVLQRRVLPQHTDHAGVMWHGAYLAWLEEARVELVLVDLSAGPDQRRLLRRLPPDLEAALKTLARGAC